MLVKVDRLCEGSRGPQVRSAKGTSPALRWWHSDNPRLCNLCGRVARGRAVSFPPARFVRRAVRRL